jgi:hypothetical protein
MAGKPLLTPPDHPGVRLSELAKIHRMLTGPTFDGFASKRA